MWNQLLVISFTLSGCLGQLKLPADVELTLFSPMVSLNQNLWVSLSYPSNDAMVTKVGLINLFFSVASIVSFMNAMVKEHLMTRWMLSAAKADNMGISSDYCHLFLWSVFHLYQLQKDTSRYCEVPSDHIRNHWVFSLSCSGTMQIRATIVNSSTSACQCRFSSSS